MLYSEAVLARDTGSHRSAGQHLLLVAASFIGLHHIWLISEVISGL